MHQVLPARVQPAGDEQERQERAGGAAGGQPHLSGACPSRAGRASAAGKLGPAREGDVASAGPRQVRLVGGEYLAGDSHWGSTGLALTAARGIVFGFHVGRGEVDVAGGGVDVRVSQQGLHHGQVHAGLGQRGAEGVPQRVRCPGRDPSGGPVVAEDRPQPGRGQRPPRRGALGHDEQRRRVGVRAFGQQVGCTTAATSPSSGTRRSLPPLPCTVSQRPPMSTSATCQREDLAGAQPAVEHQPGHGQVPAGASPPSSAGHLAGSNARGSIPAGSRTGDQATPSKKDRDRPCAKRSTQCGPRPPGRLLSLRVSSPPFARSWTSNDASAATNSPGSPWEAAEGVATADQNRLQVTRALTLAAEWALSEIDSALQRLDEGSYGICERCAEPIPEERLEVLPMSRLCTPCQYLADSCRSNGVLGGQTRSPSGIR